MDLDLDKFRDLYFSEAEEHLEILRRLIPQWEKEPENAELVHQLFRASHSLKGMSYTMGFSAIAEQAHKMEDLLDKLRDSTREESGAAEPRQAKSKFEIQQTVDFLYGFLAELEKKIRIEFSGETPPSAPEPDVPEVEAEREPEVPLPEQASLLPQYVRINPVLLDHLLGWIGELILIKNRWEEISLAGKKRFSPEIREAGGEDFIAEMEPEIRKLNRVTATLQQEVLKLRLLPLNVIFDRVPGMVRDLARERQVRIEVSCSGGGVKLDRSLIEAMQDPVFHIIRNMIDHGIENPDERLELNKAPAGRIRISAERRQEWIYLWLEDDGRGLDPDRIKEKAREKGLLDRKKAETISDSEAWYLITCPGFSTAEKVTESSGRGVGMDLVLHTVRSLGGSLGIQSRLGEGTRFEIRLPVSAAIVKLLTVQVGREVCAVPVNQISRIIQMEAGFDPGDSWVPVFSFAGLLGWEGERERKGKDQEGVAIFMELPDWRLAVIRADRILRSLDAVVRPLGPPLSRLSGVMGAIILADGRPVLVIDPAGLIKTGRG